MLRDWLDSEIADAAKAVLNAGAPDLAVGTSKTFRSLARLTGRRRRRPDRASSVSLPATVFASSAFISQG